MPLYVKDNEVEALAARLAGLRKVSKTEAVREALRHALERETGKPSLVEIGVDFCRALRARGNPRRGRPADKAFRDSLYEER
ncbi:MAG: type II toxin-antitoxin system VapB family antitoxin [Ferrovibrio sp.]